MSDQQERKPIPKTAFDEIKLRLTGPLQEGAKRPPALRVSVIRNNPRIDVFTNVENDKDNGRISAPMEALTIFALMTKLEEISKGPSDVQVKISNKTGRPGEQKLLSTTVIGKDKEGRCFISIIAQDRPRIKFTFMPSGWHEFVDKEGNPVPQAEVSCIYARAWASLMSKLVTNVMVQHFEEYDFRARNPNQGGGSNKGSYSANNNYKKKSAPEPDYDEDFTM